jgi:N5-(cytidine 5'-diphosphoramidyl)-L-glutamine hydrolase
MKLLGVTQRVDDIKDYGETRDALDKQWSYLAKALNFYVLPLSNHMPLDKLTAVLNQVTLDAIVFTGGNTLVELEPEALNTSIARDQFENKLLSEALERKIPTLGVCRGMQMINLFLGGGLEQVEGHRATRHTLDIIEDYKALMEPSVNSYHQWGIPSTGLATGLNAFAKDSLGYVEGFTHTEYRLAGMMWHPEREQPFKQKDLALMKRFLL